MMSLENTTPPVAPVVRCVFRCLHNNVPLPSSVALHRSWLIHRVIHCPEVACRHPVAPTVVCRITAVTRFFNINRSGEKSVYYATPGFELLL